MFSGNFAKFVAPKHKAMINTNEVRVGNFVLNHKKEPTKVMQTLMDNIGGAINGWDETNFDPIPLTEEWLLKAGFELYDYEPNEEGDEFPDFIYMSYKITPPEKLYYYTITNTPEDGGYFDFCIKVQFADYVMLSTLQYVHQLQNLYFALTGKELEFKL